MLSRKRPGLLLFVVATTAGLLAAGGLVNAEAAQKPKPEKPKPAVPNGHKAFFELDQFGPTAKDNVALKWSEQTLGLVRTSALPPTAVSRALAVVQTSVYDAWAAYDAVAVGTELGASLRRPAEEHTVEYKSKAISYAAYRALLDLFPAAEQRAKTRAFMTALGYPPDDAGTDPTTPQGIGNRAAAAVLAARADDGSNQHGEKNGRPYSDWTGYTPVNTADKLVDPFRWQPLRLPGAAAPQNFATPHWGRVTPFALSRPDQFPVPGPDLRKDYKQEVHDILKTSEHLSDKQKVIAEYWSDGPSTELPPGHGAVFAAALCRMQGAEVDHLDNDVKLLFLQANAVLDAGVAVWHYKVAHDFVRPVTLVRHLRKGQRIKAWGGPTRGTVTMLGEEWMPYQPANFVTPPFAEYVSGHSTFTAATFEVLRTFTGSDRLGLQTTIKAGGSRIEGSGVTVGTTRGTTPKTDVTLKWPTMQLAAAEAGESRQNGGIHFSEGDLHGRELGRKIGRAVIEKAEAYFNGTAGS